MWMHACMYVSLCVCVCVVLGAQTPAVSETLGGVEAASRRRSLASEQQEGGPALKASTEEPSDSSSDITIGEVQHL